MTYKVSDKLGIERKNWKTAFLTSIYNETATVHGRIDRSENKLEDWWSFDDARIIEMDGKTALKWWRTWKPILQQIIATSPANATEERMARTLVVLDGEPK